MICHAVIGMSLFGPTLQDFRAELAILNLKLEKILMKQSELAAALEAVKNQLSKAKDEILAEIEKLKSSDPDISPEGVAAIENLQAIGQALDDVVADVPPVE